MPPAPGRVRAEVALSAPARATLARVAGGRSAEELVLLAGAVAFVVATAEAVEQTVVQVQRPDGRVVCDLDLSTVTSAADLILATDAAVAAGKPVPSPGEVLVASAAVATPPLLAPVTVTLGPIGEDPRRLRIDLDRSRFEQWFADVLSEVVDHTLGLFGRPREPLAGLDPLPAAAADTLAGWERGCDTAARDRTLLSDALRHAALQPLDPAVTDRDGHRLTYGELFAAAERVAGRLPGYGVRQGDAVVVTVRKTWQTLAVILGVLRAGAAYVPLDPKLPPARARAVLTDVSPRLVIEDGPSANAGLPEHQHPTVTAADLVRQADPGIEPDLPELPRPDDLAYVIYTSGSSGVPKGVQVRHRAVQGFVEWRRRHHGMERATRLLLVPSLFFDSSVADVFSVLAAGGELILLDEDHRLDAGVVCDVVRRYGVTHATFVPSLYQMLLDDLARGADSLLVVTVAGEAVPAHLVRRHRRLLPDVRLVNEYGPTENSVGSTALEYGPGPWHGHPIGRPVAGTVVKVLDPHGRRLPPGFAGEICLAGPGLADGYRGQPESTARVFREAPDEPGGRRYHTGDRGWWRPDGVLEFLGRVDRQVKIRGNRVELGDVEAGLAAVPGVETVAVVPVGDGVSTTALVAYVSGPASADPPAIRTHVRRSMPVVMVPEVVVGLAVVPVTPNGKVDRAALARRAAADLAAHPAPGPTLLGAVSAGHESRMTH
ncbi:amino acid adenylation domain-containing protein [Micromonospora sp. NPDC000663]|uniref:amino acid adenylation domain-containing protein n=1 Tax=Micromonospora sp. NPDC000663 TaxID=3364218 RepID=UPI0036AF5AA4